jgi:flagellar motor switch protein FliN/FliY
MAENIAATPLHCFLEAVRQATSSVLARVFKGQWSVQIESDAAPLSQPSSYCVGLSASGGLQGEATVRICNTDAFTLPLTFLSESAGPSKDPNQAREEGLKKLVRQVAELASANLKGNFGETKLELSDGASSLESSNSKERIFTLLASGGSSEKLTLQLCVGSALMRSVESKSDADSNSSTEPELSRNASRQPNIDLLLGVNLSLTLRFGRRVLALRDILELTSGSVVELDQEVQEPADLLLGDKLIARGQVVIVDGNYGIQITEVTEAQQRIGTL